MTSSLVIGVAFGVLAMTYSLCLYRYQLSFFDHIHVDQWAAPGDVWQSIDAGRFVWAGALDYVYRGSGSLALPLSFIVAAPVATIIDHFHLVENVFPIVRPSAWLVAGPFSLAFGPFLLDAVRRLAWDLGMRRRLWAVQVSAAFIALAPSFYWGHFEDVLALIFVVHAIRSVVVGRSIEAGLLLSLAASSKQWAILLVPWLVFNAPIGRRFRTAVAACALPFGFALFFLAIDFHETARALFSPVNLGRNTLGHVAFYVTWLGNKTSRTSRALGVLVSVAAGWRLRRVLGGPSVLAAASVLLLMRPLFEAINYPYYWSPALLTAGLVGVAAHRRFRVRDWIWQAVAIGWALPIGNPKTASWWWAGFLLILLCIYAQVARNCGLSFPSGWAQKRNSHAPDRAGERPEAIEAPSA